MKQGWTYKKLGEVATFARGLTYSKNDEVELSKNIVLRSNNIDLIAGKLDFSELKYLKTNFAVPDEKKLHKGSLFICMSNGSKAHLGKVAYVDKDYGYAFGGFMGQITPNDEINGLYLHYALSSPYYKEYIKSLSEGANINNLKYKDLSEFIIKYPPLSEQQRIVKRLDSAFAHIDELKANAEKQVNEARALFQKALSKAMESKEGWEEKKIKDVIENLRTGLNPRVHFKLNSSDAIGYYVTVRELKGFSFEVDSKTDRINEAAIMRINERANLLIGDVLYSGTGTIGRTAIVKEPPTWWGIKEGVYALTPKRNKLNAYFLVYVMHSDSFKNKVMSKSSGTTVRSIPMKELKEVCIPIPPLSEQQRIVSRLDSLSKNVKALEENQRKVMAECDALKQALLRKVFE